MKTIISILTILVSSTVYAVSESNSESMMLLYKECGNLSSYRWLSGCFDNVYQESDELLNREYQSLIEYLGDDDEQNLKNAQRQWIKFRDADCLFNDPRDDTNSIARANQYTCLASRTIERLKHLEQYNWNKGCNGCPW